MNDQRTYQHTLLAGIDFSHSDEKVIALSTLFQTIYSPINLVFYHVIPPEEYESPITDIQTKVKQRVEAYLDGDNYGKFDVLVETGDKEALWIEKSKDIGVDLLILGRKTNIDKPFLTHRLINTSGCSLCLVPEHAGTVLKQVVVGVDFSKESKSAVEAALALANNTGAEIHCVNVYSVPVGFYSSGKSYEEYAEIMKQNALRAAEEFRKKMGNSLPLDFDFVLDEDDSPSDKLSEYAAQKNADLVCVGSGGLSPFAAIFFDTTVEKIMDFSKDVPLLIIKDKNKNKGFWEAIREQ